MSEVCYLGLPFWGWQDCASFWRNCEGDLDSLSIGCLTNAFEPFAFHYEKTTFLLITFFDALPPARYVCRELLGVAGCNGQTDVR